MPTMCCLPSADLLEAALQQAKPIRCARSDYGLETARWQGAQVAWQAYVQLASVVRPMGRMPDVQEQSQRGYS